MKNKKWLLSAVMAMVVLVMMTGTALTASAAAVNFSVSGGSVKAGDTIAVEVSVKGNGIAGIEGELVFDDAAFSIANAEQTDVLDPNGIVIFNETDGKFGTGKFVYASAKSKDLNGTVFTYTLKALDTANGDYELKFDGLMVAGQDGKEIESEGGTALLKVQGTGTPHQVAGKTSAGGDSTMLILIIAGVVLAGLVAVFIVLSIRKKRVGGYYR